MRPGRSTGASRSEDRGRWPGRRPRGGRACAPGPGPPPCAGPGRPTGACRSPTRVGGRCPDMAATSSSTAALSLGHARRRIDGGQPRVTFSPRAAEQPHLGHVGPRRAAPARGRVGDLGPVPPDRDPARRGASPSRAMNQGGVSRRHHGAGDLHDELVRRRRGRRLRCRAGRGRARR